MMMYVQYNVEPGGSIPRDLYRSIAFRDAGWGTLSEPCHRYHTKHYYCSRSVALHDMYRMPLPYPPPRPLLLPAESKDNRKNAPPNSKDSKHKGLLQKLQVRHRKLTIVFIVFHRQPHNLPRLVDKVPKNSPLLPCLSLSFFLSRTISHSPIRH